MGNWALLAFDRLSPAFNSLLQVSFFLYCLWKQSVVIFGKNCFTNARGILSQRLDWCREFLLVSGRPDSSIDDGCAPFTVIDYRCEDGRFLVSRNGTISNPDFASSSEIGVNPGGKKAKKKNTVIWMSSMLKSHWWCLFHKKVNTGDRKTWFRIWQFRTTAWKLYLRMHLLSELFVYWGWWP